MYNVDVAQAVIHTGVLHALVRVRTWHALAHGGSAQQPELFGHCVRSIINTEVLYEHHARTENQITVEGRLIPSLVGFAALKE